MSSLKESLETVLKELSILKIADEEIEKKHDSNNDKETVSKTKLEGSSENLNLLETGLSIYKKLLPGVDLSSVFSPTLETEYQHNFSSNSNFSPITQPTSVESQAAELKKVPKAVKKQVTETKDQLSLQRYTSSNSSMSSISPFNTKNPTNMTYHTVTSGNTLKSVSLNNKGKETLESATFLTKTSDNNTSKVINDEVTVESKSKLIPVFIGDLHHEINEDFLLNHFNEFKTIVSIKICNDLKDPKKLNYGYMNFRDPEEAKNALEKYNYKPIMGVDVRMMYSLRNSLYRKNMGTNVFFSELPLHNKSITTRIFYEEFSKYGSIFSCKLDARKNIGFIYFENAQCAAAAIQDYNEKEFFGSKIKCGIHFDKQIRNLPQFGKRLKNINQNQIIKETIDDVFLTHNENQNDNDEVKKIENLFITNTISISNIGKSCTQDEILNHFCATGPIKSVYIPDKSEKAANINITAFVTYKKTHAAMCAIEKFNNSTFNGQKIYVNASLPKQSMLKLNQNTEPNSCASKIIKEKPKLGGFYYPNAVKTINITNNVNKNLDFLSNGYKLTVYLYNLSEICNYDFFKFLCAREKIEYSKILLPLFEPGSSTFAGYVVCKSKEDSEKLFLFLNNKMVGDSVIKCSWKPDTTTKYIHKQPRTKINGVPIKFRKDIVTNKEQISSKQKKYKISNENLKSSDMITTMSMIRKEYSREKEAVSIIERKNILNVLQKEVAKYIEDSKYSMTTKPVNLVNITEYVFEVYWKGNIELLAKYIVFLHETPSQVYILQNQIEEAIAILGFNDDSYT